MRAENHTESSGITVFIMNKSGNITVVKAQDNFEKVHTSAIRTLSAEVLGVYVKILSFGSKWNLNINGLTSVLGLSKERVRKAIVSLEKEGYIVRKPVRGDSGKMCGWDYFVYPYPVEEEIRSCAGRKTNHETDNTECGLVAEPTCQESNNTEVPQVNNNREETISDYNNNRENLSLSNKDVDEFVERMYAMYPTRCPVQDRKLGKSYEDKKRIRKLLKTYTKEQIEQVFKEEIDSKYGKSYMRNFSTFLNNFPEPNATSTCEQKEEESKDFYYNEKGELVIGGVIYR